MPLTRIGVPIEISKVPQLVDSQEELESKFDTLIAYHGTSHRFRDSVIEHGLDAENPFQMEEGGKSEKPLVFFGPQQEEDMNPPASELHGAREYGNNTVTNTVGGKSIVVECELPIKNLERDDVAEVDNRGVENLYQSIRDYGVAAHRGTVPPENIRETFTTHDIPRPPIHNTVYQGTEEYHQWMKSFQGDEIDEETLKQIGTNYDTQVDPRQLLEEGEESITAEELYRRAEKGKKF
ncbi:MAG: hypothetical protein ABEK16_02700 [Candidatus Nanohalobium sp.]